MASHLRQVALHGSCVAITTMRRSSRRKRPWLWAGLYRRWKALVMRCPPRHRKTSPPMPAWCSGRLPRHAMAGTASEQPCGLPAASPNFARHARLSPGIPTLPCAVSTTRSADGSPADDHDGEQSDCQRQASSWSRSVPPSPILGWGSRLAHTSLKRYYNNQSRPPMFRPFEALDALPLDRSQRRRHDPFTTRSRCL